MSFKFWRSMNAPASIDWTLQTTKPKNWRSMKSLPKRPVFTIGTFDLVKTRAFSFWNSRVTSAGTKSTTFELWKFTKETPDLSLDLPVNEWVSDLWASERSRLVKRHSLWAGQYSRYPSRWLRYSHSNSRSKATCRTIHSINKRPKKLWKNWIS